MSYRTYIEDTQVFGNHERYPEWIEFIKSQGITVSDDGEYDGYITDIMGMISVAETIVMNMERKRREKRNELITSLKAKNASEEQTKKVLDKTFGVSSLFSFEDLFDKIENEDTNSQFHTSFTDQLIEYVKNAYMFIPYAIIKACESKIEPDKPFSTYGHFYSYKVKNNEKIHVFAR